MYPLILTHLNPYYFKNFTFASQKIYFLKKSKPTINKDFRALSQSVKIHPLKKTLAAIICTMIRRRLT